MDIKNSINSVIFTRQMTLQSIYHFNLENGWCGYCYYYNIWIDSGRIYHYSKYHKKDWENIKDKINTILLYIILLYD